MVRNFEPYIPTGMGALMDFVGTMMSGAPVFKDTIGDLPNKNIETKFYQLYEGLKLARPELGEELYAQLRTMGEQVYAHFLADQGGETEETTKGCKIIHQMDDLLIAHARRGR